MFEGFDKLPQFLQLCIGSGCLIGAAYAIYAAVKARKFFGSSKDRDEIQADQEEWQLREKFAESRAKVYDKMEQLGKRLDQRYDSLEQRVRANEVDIAEMKGKARHR